MSLGPSVCRPEDRRTHDACGITQSVNVNAQRASRAAMRRPAAGPWTKLNSHRAPPARKSRPTIGQRLRKLLSGDGRLSCLEFRRATKSKGRETLERKSGDGEGRIDAFSVSQLGLCRVRGSTSADASSRASAPMHPNSAPNVRRCCCLCVPGSSPGKTPDDRRVVQMEQWLAGRSRNRSQVFPVMEPNGNRSLPHLGRSSLPDGKACSAWGSNNRVPERTPDPQR